VAETCSTRVKNDVLKVALKTVILSVKCMYIVSSYVWKGVNIRSIQCKENRSKLSYDIQGMHPVVLTYALVILSVKTQQFKITHPPYIRK
jgi:hypothetical protein